eukprot:877596-Pelagomonas_calceolata.AAC.6
MSRRGARKPLRAWPRSTYRACTAPGHPIQIPGHLLYYSRPLPAYMGIANFLGQQQKQADFNQHCRGVRASWHFPAGLKIGQIILHTTCRRYTPPDWPTRSYSKVNLTLFKREHAPHVTLARVQKSPYIKNLHATFRPVFDTLNCFLFQIKNIFAEEDNIRASTLTPTLNSGSKVGITTGSMPLAGGSSSTGWQSSSSRKWASHASYNNRCAHHTRNELKR